MCRETGPCPVGPWQKDLVGSCPKDLVGSCPALEDDGETVKKMKGTGRMEPLHPEPEPLRFLGLRLSQTTIALSGVKPQLGYLLLP